MMLLSLSPVWLTVIPWPATRQASLSITNSRSLLKLMSIESAMPSNHLIFCRPLLLPPSIFPSIEVFSNESVLRVRWAKYFYHSWWVILHHDSSLCSEEPCGVISANFSWDNPGSDHLLLLLVVSDSSDIPCSTFRLSWGGALVPFDGK